MKKIIIGFFAFVFLLLGTTSAFAYVSWNTDPGDCPGSGIGIHDGVGVPPTGSNDCWNLTSVSGNSGDSVNVQLYYHNTGNEPATNTKVYITVSPSLGTSSTTHTFKSSLSANPSGTYLGTTTLHLPTAQSLSIGPNDTWWFPNQTTSNPITSGAQITTSSGLSLGTINNGWDSQGTVVVAFKVGNTQPPQNCTIDNFNANPTSITAGASSVLSWNTTGCASVKLNNSNVSLDGSQTVSPTTTTTYTLKAYNSAGALMDTDSKTVTVNTVVLNCSINSFTASPTTINAGQYSILNWKTTNCSNVSISPLNYNVPTTGTQQIWPNQTTTYTLTATGSNGGVQTKSVTVNVNGAASTVCKINSFEASPSSIQNGGTSVLSWETINCTAVMITPYVGTLSVNGSKAVNPTSTTTYTLKAVSTNGTTQTRTTTVTVNSVAPNNCSIDNFTANPTTIISGNSSTLNWSTSNCASVKLYSGSTLINTYGPNGTKSVSPTSTTTYTLKAYSASGALGGTKTTTVIVGNTVPLTCSINKFTANPTTIHPGQSSNLSWDTSNCVSVVLGGAEVVTSGNKSVSPTVTTTYTLTATGSNGVVKTRSVTVTVSTIIVSGCTINNFTANPTSIANGDSSTLSWSTSNCQNVTISNLGYSVPTTGNQEVWPTQNTTYVLTAYNSNNGAVQTRSVTIYVNSTSSLCKINNFTANPNSIESGDSSTLSWSTSNCSNVSISSIGSVSTTGSKIVYPTNTKTYVLTAEDQYGNTVDTASTTVYVNDYNNDTCEIVNFEASDTSIDEGDYSKLIWETNNCSQVKITVLGNVNDDGDEKVYPTSDKTYTLTAYNSNGQTKTATVRIYVDEDNTSNDDECTIDSYSATDTYISRGDEVILRWRTTDCDDVSISNIGDVDDDGSEDVTPYSTTTYVLRAEGNNGSDSESIKIYVDYNGGSDLYNTNVVTTVATNISQNAAQLNGLLTSSSYSNDNISTYFEYGTTVNLGMRTASRSSNGNSNLTEYVNNLSPNTIYFFRARAEGVNGISVGAIEIFKTQGYVNYNNNYNNNTTIRTVREVVYEQGTTVMGSMSPVVLRIENKYQTIGVGDMVDYVVFYKNISTSVLERPMVQVYVPQGFTITNTSRGTYSHIDRTLSVPINDLRPDEEGVIYLQARVDTLDVNLAQIVTTAILVYTNPNGAQENAMAYVLNNPRINNNMLGASAFFGGMFGMSLIGWLLLIIVIMLLILLSRSYFNRHTTSTVTHL